MSAVTTSTQSQQVAPISKLWWVGLVAAGASALGNVVFYFISRILGVSYLMPVDPSSTELVTLPLMVVIIASVIPAIGATIFYAILGKFLTRPLTVFWVISTVLLVVSFVMPIVNLPATVDTPTILALEVMHVISAIAIVGILTTLGREK